MRYKGMLISLSTHTDKVEVLGSEGAPDEPIRLAFGKVLLSLFALFNQKQNERGPGNVIKAGMDGILTQAQERIERIRAAFQRGQTDPAELRANILDLAGFGAIATMIFDGTWVGADGAKPSLTCSEPRNASTDEGLEAMGLAQDALRESVRALAESTAENTALWGRALDKRIDGLVEENKKLAERVNTLLAGVTGAVQAAVDRLPPEVPMAGFGT